MQKDFFCVLPHWRLARLAVLTSLFRFVLLIQLAYIFPCLPAHAASLTAALNAAPSSVNLTELGSSDWTHWSGNNFNRKAGVTPHISTYTPVGSETPASAGSKATYVWTDGTPLAFATTQTGVRIFNAGNGFQFTAPAGSASQTLRVYVGLKYARGLFNATLSDGSAPAYSTLIDQPSGLGSHVVTLNYQAASTGQSLTVRFTLDTRYQSSATGSQLSLESAALSVSTGGGGTQGTGLTLPFTDNFNYGNAQGWSVFDEAGNPSDWKVVAGQYTQASQVRSGRVNFLESYHLGSFSYLSDGSGLQNYRISVDIIPRGAQGDDIGVMFRYQNPNNYYRLSMDSRYGYTRLEKRINGKFTALASNTTGYRFGQLVNVTIEVQGSTILVYLNNDPLFATQDTSLSQGSVALYSTAYSVFDNVSIQQASTQPAVVLSRPVALNVVSTARFTVSAQVINPPAGRRVDFILDGIRTISDSTAPYSVTFKSIPRGNHTVEARLKDPSGNTVASDINTKIGAQGTNYLTVGDSITNGAFDNYSSDNASQDGRIFGFQGYQALLNDALTETRGRPHLVVNEGVGGDTSALTANVRIASILLRNPDSNQLLMFLGTNDAATSLPVPSGLGCTGTECNGTYKGYMQGIINSARNAGKSVTVAMAPPSFGSAPTSTPYANPQNTTRNIILREYNQVISNELANRSLGPDLYQCFLGYANRFSLFADNYHPNGLGYAVIAQLWHDILTGNTQPADACATLPRFTLENLSRSTVLPFIKQNVLEVGDTYYVNASFTLTSIPQGLALENGVWIMNSNTSSDRNNTSVSNYLSFQVDRAVSVYVGYDKRATSLPSWLTSYTNTGKEIGVSQSGARFALYRRNFSAGNVSLGGNLATPASGALSNYLIIVVPQ